MIGKSIRPVKVEDIKSICGIYNYYVENTNISFEEQAVSEAEMERRVRTVMQEHSWLVCEIDGEVAGYAYAGKWKDRSAYRFTLEDTVYVKNGLAGKGVGKALLGNLIAEMRKEGKHVAMAVIALPNERSIRLHESFGFKKAAHFKEVGFKNNQWIDVGYWELQLEENT
jgi:phosphinothricin acetyltransferase